jgi:urocanate hydratase
VPAGFALDDVRALRSSDPHRLAAASTASVVRHVTAMLGFQRAGAIVFDNGNLIRTQARKGGVEDAFDIPVFSEAFLRPLFCRGIGPFRWIALANHPADIARIDDLVLRLFPANRIVSNWIRLAREEIPFQGLPARIAWLGHGERTELGLAVNEMVRRRELSGPIAFTRDHLDGAAMTHPNIMTERMRDGSDAIADWPLLNALVSCSSMADLVAIHSGGGGYTGYMTSAGVTVIADGSEAADQRLALTLTNDTALGVMRYADAGYAEAIEDARKNALRHFPLAR